MGWMLRWGSLWMVIPSGSAPHFVTPSMGILFPILRRTEVSILWSSFFLSFMWFVNCILGIPSFWANIHLSVSACVFFCLGIPHSGWYPPLEPLVNPCLGEWTLSVDRVDLHFFVWLSTEVGFWTPIWASGSHNLSFSHEPKHSCYLHSTISRWSKGAN